MMFKPLLNLARYFASFPGQLGIADMLLGRTLAKRGILITETYSGISWKLDLNNPTHRWLVYGHYQGPALYAWAMNNLPRCPSVVLSGANIGQMILEFQSLVHRGTIHAFEPDPHAYQWLCECLELNPSLPVKLVQQGLGDSHATQKFTSGQWGHTHGSQSFISDAGDLEISVTTLDQYFEQNDQEIDLWILDIEGYEAHALVGAQRLIRAGKVHHIWMEIPAGDARHQSMQLMQDYGYTPYLLRWDGSFYDQKVIPDKHTDALFVRNT